MIESSVLKKLGVFAGGVLFGTAGIKVLSSKDAKKVYTGCTAAVLRAKDCVMKTASTVQENAERKFSRTRLAAANLRQRQQRLNKLQDRVPRIEPYEENRGALLFAQEEGFI